MHYTAERHPFAIDQLRAAEDKAKAAKKNIWKNYVESSVDETGDAFSNSLSLGSGKSKKEPYTALISEIREPADENDLGIYLAIQHGANAEQNIEQIQTLLSQEMKENPPLTGAFRPTKKGEILAAKWPADNEWYRAQVDRIQDKNVTLTFVDFGNVDTFNYIDRVGKLPANVDMSAFAAQAKVVRLAFVEYPKQVSREINIIMIAASCGRGDFNRELCLTFKFRFLYVT